MALLKWSCMVWPFCSFCPDVIPFSLPSLIFTPSSPTSCAQLKAWSCMECISSTALWMLSFDHISIPALPYLRCSPWSTYFNNYLLHFLTHLSWFFFMRAVCFASLFTKSLGGLWLYLCSPLPPQHQEQLKAWRDAHQRSMNGWFMVSYMSASWRPVLLCLWMHLTQHWASSFQQRTWHAAPNEWRGVFKCWCLHIVTDIGKHGKPGFSQESV